MWPDSMLNIYNTTIQNLLYIYQTLWKFVLSCIKGLLCKRSVSKHKRGPDSLGARMLLSF